VSDHLLLRSGAHRQSGPVTRLGRLVSSAAGTEAAAAPRRAAGLAVDRSCLTIGGIAADAFIHCRVTSETKTLARALNGAT
jgi:hypothetical protein